MRRSRWLLGTCLAMALGTGRAAAQSDLPPCPRCVADFAIYDPDREDDGVWEEDVTAIATLLDSFGFTYRRVDAAAIRGGALGEGGRRRYRALLEPGGWAYTRDAALGASGVTRLRRFVRQGGGFVGFCAGAWSAVSTVRFDAWTTGWYAATVYNLRLFDGAGWGPLAWVPWPQANFSPVVIDTANPVMAAIAMPERTRLVYGGGPWFEARVEPPHYEIWARAEAPRSATRRDGDGEATIVRYASGKGTVVLFAYHPEILIGSDQDGVRLADPYDEDAIDWDTGDLTLEEIHRDGRNLVHAALQVAAGAAPTPLR